MTRLIKDPRLWLVFVIAISIRLLHWLSIHHALPEMSVMGDARALDRYAWKIASGAMLTETVQVHFLPVYLAFLSGLYKIGGHSPSLGVWTQILLGSLTCAITYKLGRLLWNRKVGLTAGIITSLYGIFIFFDTVLLRSSLINFLQVLLLYFLTLLALKPRIIWGVLSGFCLGTLVMTRGNFLFFVPGALVWMLGITLWSFPRKRDSKGWTPMVLAFFCVSLWLTTQGWLFWLDRAIPKRDFLLLESGVQLYLGNNPTATGTYVPQKEFAPTIYGQSVEARRYVEKVVGHTVTPKEFNQYWWDRAKDFIFEHPMDWLLLEGKKLFLAFNAYEIPGTLNYDVLRRKSFVLSLPLFSFALIAPLGFLGILMQRKELNAGASLLIIFLGCYLLTLLVAYVQMDVRLPIQLPLILFASFALVKIGEWLASGERKSLKTAAIVFLIFYLFTNYETPLPRYQFQKNAEMSLVHRDFRSAAPAKRAMFYKKD